MTNIAIIGESWGAEEEKEQTAFVGASGYELTRMLDEAGISRSDCFLTNVFNFKPPGNKIEALCDVKAQGIPGYPALIKSKYVHHSYAPELRRLGEELCEVNPNLLLCLGNTAMWAMLGRTAISKLRGCADLSTHTVSGFKVLPTYHPAAVLREWDLRAIVVVDFQKALRESEYAELRRPKREIWIEPTLDEIELFIRTHITGCSLLSTDIETAGSRITCIGFAPSPTLGIVIPFDDPRKRGGSYWPDAHTERKAWGLVRSVLESPVPKLFQNGLYDIAFLWRAYGIKVYGATQDTMLLHHALQPESLKGLGFLGSIYTDESAWKQMREAETIKRDD